jgi:hypothetical protein
MSGEGTEDGGCFPASLSLNRSPAELRLPTFAVSFCTHFGKPPTMMQLAFGSGPTASGSEGVGSRSVISCFVCSSNARGLQGSRRGCGAVLKLSFLLTPSTTRAAAFTAAAFQSTRGSAGNSPISVMPFCSSCSTSGGVRRCCGASSVRRLSFAGLSFSLGRSAPAARFGCGSMRVSGQMLTYCSSGTCTPCGARCSTQTSNTAAACARIVSPNACTRARGTALDGRCTSESDAPSWLQVPWRTSSSLVYGASTPSTSAANFAIWKPAASSIPRRTTTMLREGMIIAY